MPSSWGGYGLAGEVEVEVRCEGAVAVVDSRAIVDSSQTDEQAVLLADTQELVWASEVMMASSSIASRLVVPLVRALPARQAQHHLASQLHPCSRCADKRRPQESVLLKTP